jgi:hypothetical protein
MAGRRQDPSTWITVERQFNPDADNGAIFSELFEKVLGVKNRKFTDIKKKPTNRQADRVEV